MGSCSAEKTLKVPLRSSNCRRPLLDEPETKEGRYWRHVPHGREVPLRRKRSTEGTNLVSARTCASVLTCLTNDFLQQAADEGGKAEEKTCNKISIDRWN
jgi:hypothetical protein